MERVSDMRTIFIHVGYHKTATTFLQKSIYPKLKNVNYIKKGRIKKELRHLRIKKLSDMEIENMRNYFMSFNNGQPFLISYEGLSGSPFAPKKTKKQLTILKDLRRVFPASDFDVHVIVGIREQVQLLTSLYIQYIHHGGVRSGRDYITYCEHNGSVSNFHFHEYLQKIEDVFGRDRLYVMIYEYFKQNPEEEMLKLLNYMGEPDIPPYQNEELNKSLGKVQVAIARRLNHFFKTPVHPRGRFAIYEPSRRSRIPSRVLLQNKISFALHYERYEFPKDLQASLRQRYAEGNRVLADRYHLDLPNAYFSGHSLK